MYLVTLVLFFLTLLTYPQVYHCFKNKTSNGLTHAFIILEFLTSIFFLIYGCLLGKFPIIVSNSSSLLGSILLMIAKKIYPEN